ncbi:hypothetical protein CAOG_01167 [Capsaspora owczarzaki ATCC 30864]|uniref:Nucleotide exchange factor Fes1 domain-containing protein n=1 Tax=Capsaspora owczarzaki (strain ATCC 30864) TaxID=595528 RepID=A0A0D2WJV6_CAPO3|nr:hypothetical protein CAOG_01167 [Capsaspora owczarzaki ATCC 30864]KJE89738.1 hypothetical protein CAOG_001167 [Capsaspora owczarzaki ATCC 30864]|eukprot:XP_004366038.1 hypothetical protein CAOG_01167 [Capsaspora owczarzaki ATCC 30864]
MARYSGARLAGWLSIVALLIAASAVSSALDHQHIDQGQDKQQRFPAAAAAAVVAVSASPAESSSASSADAANTQRTPGQHNTPPPSELTTKFVPTHEWQDLHPDQPVPPGLHIELNFETGRRRAKLLDPEPAHAEQPRDELDALENNDSEFVHNHGDVIAINVENTGQPGDERSVQPKQRKVRILHQYTKQEIKDKLAKMHGDDLHASAFCPAGDAECLLSLDQPAAAAAAAAASSERSTATLQELREAMAIMERENLLVRSDVRLMMELLEKAASPDSSEDNVVDALLVLSELVNQIDNGRDLDRIDGMRQLIGYLGSTSVAVKSAAALALGSAIHNNDEAKVDALRRDILPLLLDLVSDGTELVARRALYAMSALLRHMPQAQEDFQMLDGPQRLLSTLASTHSKAVIVKITTLVTDLVDELDHAASVLNSQVHWTLQPDSEEALDTAKRLEREALQRQAQVRLTLRDQLTTPAACMTIAHFVAVLHEADELGRLVQAVSFIGDRCFEQQSLATSIPAWANVAEALKTLHADFTRFDSTDYEREVAAQLEALHARVDRHLQQL